MAMLLYGMALAAVVTVLSVHAKRDAFGADQVPVFAISLARSTRRRARLLKQAEGVHIIDAVDGTLLVSPVQTQPNGERELTRGERGCFLSHVKAWKAARATQADVSLILEDDANIKLPEQWPSILQLVRECPDTQWDIIFLGVNDNPIETSPRVSPNLRKLQTHAYGAHALLISRKGLDALLGAYEADQLRAHGVELPLDFWITEQPLRMYWADPKLVEPFDVRDSETMRVQ
jgi:GR25 family glycosyltransferase involved in LPS biosynthesis